MFQGGVKEKVRAAEVERNRGFTMGYAAQE
jgi:hypothetical protein